jgi:hypothetical protein
MCHRHFYTPRPLNSDVMTLCLCTAVPCRCSPIAQPREHRSGSHSPKQTKFNSLNRFALFREEKEN